MLSIGSVAGSLGVGLIRHSRRPYLMAAALAFGVLLTATALAPDVIVACVALLVTGATAFSFVTLCSTTLQLHSAPGYRGRVMPRAALLTGAAACLAATAIAARVRTPPHPDATLTDLAPDTSG